MEYNIVITAGGTSEKIDNVRKITNSSSGKLGYTIANKILMEKKDSINKIFYVCSKNAFKPRNEKVQIIEIVDTLELQNVVLKLLKDYKIDYFIHSMAVSDYTVDFITTVEDIVENILNNPNKDLYELICNNSINIKQNKISSDKDNLLIKLKRTPKIISLIKKLSPETHLIGFKLLDGVKKNELIDVALKLKEKNKCDLVIANDLDNIRKGNHLAFLVKSKDEYIKASGKEDIANKLVSEIF